MISVSFVSIFAVVEDNARLAARLVLVLCVQRRLRDMCSGNVFGRRPASTR